MRVGNLVKIKSARIGIPAGAIGLIIEGNTSYGMPSSNPIEIWTIQFLNGKERRYLTRDLEIIN